MTEWISVKDRLPEIDKKVIIWNMDIPDIEYMEMGYYDKNYDNKYEWRTEEYTGINVTHWRYLPEPPHE